MGSLPTGVQGGISNNISLNLLSSLKIQERMWLAHLQKHSVPTVSLWGDCGIHALHPPILVPMRL